MTGNEKQAEDYINNIITTAKDAVKQGRFGLLFFEVREVKDGTKPRILWIRGHNMTMEEFDGFIRRILSEQRGELSDETKSHSSELDECSPQYG